MPNVHTDCDAPENTDADTHARLDRIEALLQRHAHLRDAGAPEQPEQVAEIKQLLTDLQDICSGGDVHRTSQNPDAWTPIVCQTLAAFDLLDDAVAKGEALYQAHRALYPPTEAGDRLHDAALPQGFSDCADLARLIAGRADLDEIDDHDTAQLTEIRQRHGYAPVDLTAEVDRLQREVDELGNQLDMVRVVARDRSEGSPE